MHSIVRFEVFRGYFKSWEELLEEASRFATEIGKERIINISHSWGPPEGIVTVWYWDSSESNVSGSEKEK